MRASHMPVFATLLITLALTGCKDSASDPAPAYTDQLTLGTGLNPSNPFELIGVGTTLLKSEPIWFRLESSADMAGSDVRIVITTNVGGNWMDYQSPVFSNPQSYGHIFLSSFIIDDPGSYKARGVLVATGATVASTSFIVK